MQYEIIQANEIDLALIEPLDETAHYYDWLRYFSPAKALEQVSAHIATLSSTGRTDNTRKIYNAGLAYFFEWCNADENLAHPFPDTELLKRYIAHLSYDKPNQRGGSGLAARTIASKYLAPLRLYLKELRLQRVSNADDPMTIIEYKNHLDESLSIKNPKPKTTTHQSALYAHGNRLTKSQVDSILSSFNLATLKGKRNYALMFTAFTVALRLSELRALTLSDIKQSEQGYECRVTGKRANSDPVYMSPYAVSLIREWVTAYNEIYEPDDPCYISDDSPIFQPLRKGDNRTGKPADQGLTNDGIARVVKSVSRRVIGFEISPHDCRRTYAALARLNGLEMDAIQSQLRHSSVATTQKYIGPLKDISKSDLSRVIEFAEPAKQQSLLKSEEYQNE